MLTHNALHCHLPWICLHSACNSHCIALLFAMDLPQPTELPLHVASSLVFRLSPCAIMSQRSNDRARGERGGRGYVARFGECQIRTLEWVGLKAAQCFLLSCSGSTFAFTCFLLSTLHHVHVYLLQYTAWVRGLHVQMLSWL